MHVNYISIKLEKTLKKLFHPELALEYIKRIYIFFVKVLSQLISITYQIIHLSTLVWIVVYTWIYSGLFNCIPCAVSDYMEISSCLDFSFIICRRKAQAPPSHKTTGSGAQVQYGRYRKKPHGATILKLLVPPSGQFSWVNLCSESGNPFLHLAS